MKSTICNSNLVVKAKWMVAVVLLMTSAAVAQTSVERVVVVSIPDRKLAVVENGEVTKIYPVAVGKDSTPSPTGTYHIANRITDPTYYHPHKVIAAGPQNPLGNRWIGLDTKGYGIHGTNVQSSIGKAASHGCIRVGRKDLEELFTIVRVGDTVEIVGERDEETAQIFGSANEQTSNAVVMAQADSHKTSEIASGGQ